jgi:hypothetical protein
MLMAPPNLSGKYVGRSMVREGREDELSPQERKQLKAGAAVDLDLRPDGTFTKQVTEGTWEIEGERVVFHPTKFGGKTLDEMRTAAEEMGRAFGLAFVFIDFELLIQGDVLVTPDTNALIYTQFSRE